VKTNDLTRNDLITLLDTLHYGVSKFCLSADWINMKKHLLNNDITYDIEPRISSNVSPMYVIGIIEKLRINGYVDILDKNKENITMKFNDNFIDFVEFMIYL